MSVAKCLETHVYSGISICILAGVGATAQGEAVKDNVVELGIWFHEEDFEASRQAHTVQDLKAISKCVKAMRMAI